MWGEKNEKPQASKVSLDFGNAHIDASDYKKKKEKRKW